MSPFKLLVSLALTTLPLCACSSAAPTVPSPTEERAPNAVPNSVTPIPEMDLRTSMHDVLEDQAQWSRLLIVRGLAGGADTRAITTRLMSVDDAIATTLAPVYGPFSSMLVPLLQERDRDLGAAIDAARGPAHPEIDVSTPLYANADAIAKMLVAASPQLSFFRLQTELHAEVQATLDQIDARSRGDWAADVTAYKLASGHALALADLVTDATVQQFFTLVSQSEMSRPDQILHFTLRQLFDDNAFWMRSAIISHLAGTPDEPYADDAVVTTSVEIGAAFAPFYPSDVTIQISRHVHDATITDGVAFMLAVQAGDMATATALKATWVDDANGLAQFLADQNAAWTVPSLERRTQVYVDQLAAQITARVIRDWGADADAYDAMVLDARTFSYVLADGLATQFPQIVR
jgi:hypothetical protein